MNAIITISITILLIFILLITMFILNNKNINKLSSAINKNSSNIGSINSALSSNKSNIDDINQNIKMFMPISKTIQLKDVTIDQNIVGNIYSFPKAVGTYELFIYITNSMIVNNVNFDAMIQYWNGIISYNSDTGTFNFTVIRTDDYDKAKDGSNLNGTYAGIVNSSGELYFFSKNISTDDTLHCIIRKIN